MQQLRINISEEQRQAVVDTARKLGVAQGTLVRRGIYAVTGSPDEIPEQAFCESKQRVIGGFAKRNPAEAGEANQKP